MEVKRVALGCSCELQYHYSLLSAEFPPMLCILCTDRQLPYESDVLTVNFVYKHSI